MLYTQRTKGKDDRILTREQNRQEYSVTKLLEGTKSKNSVNIEFYTQRNAFKNKAKLETCQT